MNIVQIAKNLLLDRKCSNCNFVYWQQLGLEKLYFCRIWEYNDTYKDPAIEPPSVTGDNICDKWSDTITEYEMKKIFNRLQNGGTYENE